MFLSEIVSGTDQRNLRDAGYKIVDSVEIQGYTLTLTKMPDHIGYALGADYQIGFNKEGTDFTDYSQHATKHIDPSEQIPLSKLSAGINTIKQWIDEYGPIVVSSSQEAKTATYHKVLLRGGIHSEQKEGYGQVWLVLTRK